MARQSQEDKAAEIITLVTEHETATRNLRDRFESDYGMYLLDQRLPPEPDERPDSNEGFRIHTTNEPMTYADKIMSWLSTAKVIIRTVPRDALQDERERDDIAERFLIGCFEAADDRLVNMLLIPVQDAESFYTTVRGWLAARVMMRKDKEGKSFVDITPWDPLHTFWGVGEDGLIWACYRSKKSRADIKGIYGKTIPGTDSEQSTFDVYDYYDRENNTVVMENNMVLKKAEKHGGSSVPTVIVAVPSSPPIDSMDRDDDDKHYGESVFKANRSLYESYNLIMSVMLELTSRARKPPLDVHSRDGQKTLDEDPYLEGTALSTGDGEYVRAIEGLEMTKDVGPFLSIVSGEVQRGSLPHSIFGELQFTLSGFAIKTLRQGIDSVLQPRIKALQNFYRMSAALLREQYTSGAFENLRLTGITRQHKFFDEEIEPQVVADAAIPRIQLKAQLPEDDQAKVVFAQMAREGPTPLLGDDYLRSEVLEIQDADLMDDQIKSQTAERGLPEAQLWVLMKSAEDRGNHEIAQMYYMQLVQLMFQKMMTGMMPQGAMPPGAMPPGGAGQNGGGQNRGGPTAPPTAMPEAMFGMPPPAPTPQAGANVPPGQPRPGARTGQIA
jgi:hypothetical protein